jgi:hypothetical protein
VGAMKDLKALVGMGGVEVEMGVAVSQGHFVGGRDFCLGVQIHFLINSSAALREEN